MLQTAVACYSLSLCSSSCYYSGRLDRAAVEQRPKLLFQLAQDLIVFLSLVFLGTHFRLLSAEGEEDIKLCDKNWRGRDHGAIMVCPDVHRSGVCLVRGCTLC